jgi:serine/threonine-protein kinase
MIVAMSRDPVAKAGDVVDRYRILDKLGEGGMGTVFLGEHTLIKRRVAIKILHPELATDSAVIERFMNEARAAGTLGHPNIVESTDMGFTHEHIPYIAFEYLEGSLLTDEIYRVGGLPLRRALRIAQQIASALDAAHNAGIVHRDLKSDNIFLTDRDDVSDHVKVLDFGISRFQSVGDDSGLIMGTPEFMSPEQIETPSAVDKRTDIYALGVILYEMLAARRPFKLDDDPRALLDRIVRDEPAPLDRPELPHGLAEVVMTRMLAKAPADRYQSMLDVEAALDSFLTGDGATVGPRRRSRPIAVVVDAPRPNRKTARQVVNEALATAHKQQQKPWVQGAVIGVMLLGLVGLGVATTSTPPAARPAPAPAAALPAAAPAPVPGKIAITLDAGPTNARVLFRKRVSKAPVTMQISPSDILELVEVSAPGHKTTRYWLTLDRPTRLIAKLPAGHGSRDATDAETRLALGEVKASEDAPAPASAKSAEATGAAAPDAKPDARPDAKTADTKTDMSTAANDTTDTPAKTTAKAPPKAAKTTKTTKTTKATPTKAKPDPRAEAKAPDEPVTKPEAPPSPTDLEPMEP